jgi:hypothetical protein
LAVSYSGGDEYGVLIREKPYAQGLLRPIVNKNFLGSFSLSLIAGVRCQPLTDNPGEFVSLGDFHEYTAGYPVDIQNLVGVHRSLCVSGKPSNSIIYYNDDGSSVDSYSWDIASQEDTLNLSTITCSNNPNPRYESIWLLRKVFIEYINFVAKL